MVAPDTRRLLSFVGETMKMVAGAGFVTFRTLVSGPQSVRVK